MPAIGFETVGSNPMFIRLCFSSGGRSRSQPSPKFRVRRRGTFQSSWNHGAIYQDRKNGAGFHTALPEDGVPSRKVAKLSPLVLSELLSFHTRRVRSGELVNVNG